MGNKTYHYTSIEVFKKIVEFKKLRFTRMNSLNDKSEYKYGLQLLKNKIIEFENDNNVTNRLDTNILDKFMFPDDLYSISFTENGDNLAFWNSYYVDKINPISIGFVRDKVFNREFIINPCIYDDPYPKMSAERYSWFRQIFEIRNILKLPKNREYIHMTFQTAHIKQKAFEIENEWRAVSFPPKNVLIGKFKRGEKEIDYFDQGINLNSICEIIVGPSSHQEKNYVEILQLIVDLGLNSLVSKSDIPLEL
jgi:hypothetical protein